MPQIIDVPNVGKVEFPDSMSDDQIVSAIENDLKPAAPSMSNRIGRAAQLPVAIGKGVGRGIMDVGEGLKQVGLEAFGEPGEAEAYTKEVDARRQAYQNDPTIRDFGDTSEYFRTLANTVPFALPAGKLFQGAAKATQASSGLLSDLVGKISQNAPQFLKGAGIGAGTSAVQYVPEGGSRAFNTITGGLLGGAIPGGIMGGIKGYNFLKDRATQKIMEGVNEAAARFNKAAADRLKLSYISPAEASGNPLAAANQGTFGTSAKGAMKMQEKGAERIASEKSSIDDLINTISPKSGNAASEVRSAAKNIISKEEKALENAARPLYDDAFKQDIPEDKFKALMGDGIIKKAYDDIGKKALYSNELRGITPTSIKRLDLVKREIDDSISTAKRAGEKNAVRLLQQSKKRLTESLDEISPDYKAARGLFGKGAEPIKALKESNIGRIAKLSDTQMKRVSSIIFDPTQTDTKVLSELGKKLGKENPEAWNRMIRNHIEGTLSRVKGDINGSKFYNTFLAKDNNFKQLVIATKHIPGATQKLNDMRSVFKNLINPLTAKTSAGQSRVNLFQPRNTMDRIETAISNRILGGRYDEAGVELLTSNKWDQEFSKINKISDRELKAQKLSELLNKISAIQSAKNNNEIFKETPNAN